MFKFKVRYLCNFFPSPSGTFLSKRGWQFFLPELTRLSIRGVLEMYMIEYIDLWMNGLNRI